MSCVQSPDRLAALHSTKLLDTPPEEAFDRLTRLGAFALRVPLAMVTLVSGDRQFFKSAVGLDEPLRSVRETPLSHSICQYVVEAGRPLVCNNLQTDAALRDHPAVTERNISAYVGVPLMTPEGHALGTFCAMDRVPREWSELDLRILSDLAASTVTELMLRREVEQRQRAAEEAAQVARALGAERRRTALLLKQAPGLIVITHGPDHEVQMANHTSSAVAGGRDIIGAPLTQVWPWALEAGLASSLTQALETDAPTAVREVRIETGTGENWIVDFICQPLAGPDGRTSGVFCHGMDVTEKVDRETAVRLSEARYRLLFDGNPLPMWVYEPGDLRFIAVNNAAIAHYGYSREEFLGMSLFDLGRPEATAAVRSSLGAALPEEQCIREAEHVCKDGRTIYVDVTAGPLVLDGRTCGLILAHDVTERRAAEVAHRSSEERLRLALDVANMVVWERDLATGGPWIREVPSGGLDMHLGRDACYTDQEFLAYVHVDDRARLIEVQHDAVERRAEFTVEFRMAGPNGKQRWKQARGRVLTDSTGRPQRMIGVSRDVTDRAELEAQLRHAQKMEAVGQLAGGVAHDFNNLLTVITGGVTFIRQSLGPNAAALDDLAMVDEASARAAQLTRQLLAFSRNQVLKPELVDLNEIIQRVEPMLRRLIGEDIRIVTVPQSGSLPVLADPGQLEQVLINLAVNARDAMPSGGDLFISTREIIVTQGDADCSGNPLPAGSYSRLTVSDTGVGMDAVTLEKAFDPFFTTKGPGRGTGLGLATVYGIVEQSGGRVCAKSKLGEGTTFDIDIPAAAKPEMPAPIASTHRAPQPDRVTILLVEDEAPVRTIGRRILTKSGYTVIEAEHGRDALAQVERHEGQIDLVITDMVMPEMSGRAFANEFSGLHPHVPVLFVSGYNDDEMLRRGFRDPNMTLLEKPFSPQQLLCAVRSALEGACRA